jgi:hypothetical protein
MLASSSDLLIFYSGHAQRGIGAELLTARVGLARQYVIVCRDGSSGAPMVSNRVDLLRSTIDAAPTSTTRDHQQDIELFEIEAAALEAIDVATDEANLLHASARREERRLSRFDRR